MQPHVYEQKPHNPNSHPAKLPKGYCKKLKGQHQYAFLSREKYNQHVIDVRHRTEYTSICWFLTDQCTGCGKLKKRIKWEAPCLN